MKKALSLLLVFCFGCSFLSGCGLSQDVLADTPTEPEDYYILYNGELYTLYYKDGFRLNHAWDDLGERNPDKENAVCVSADDPSEVLYNCKIQTYRDDPDRLFIQECGSVLFDGRLLRKASAVFPDYLDSAAPIEHVLLKPSEETGKDISITAETPDSMELLLQTVRSAARNRDPAQTIPVDRTSDSYSCYIAFDGIPGDVYVGFLQKGTDGRWGFSSAEIDYSAFSDGYGLYPLGAELQSVVSGNDAPATSHP